MANSIAASDLERRRDRLLVRFWIAAGSSFLVLLLLGGLYWSGYMDPRGFVITSSSILCLVAIFYALFSSGVNFRASDPSLTVPQVLIAIAVLYVAMYYTKTDARPIIFPLVLMAFVFGVLRLPLRVLVRLAAVIVVFHAVTIGFLSRFRPHDLDLRMEILRLFFFGIVLVWFAFMGGYISRLRKRLQENRAELEKLAVHDALTGAYNRHHMSQSLLQEKDRSDRSGVPFCIGLLDIDFFKAVNDKYGHHVGDEVLKACTECGRRALRPSDSFSRHGGEEFEMLLIQTDLGTSRVVAERVRAAISCIDFSHIDPELKVTVSIGLAQYRPREEILETERRADKALYQAKAAGRNQVVMEGTMSGVSG